MSVANDLNALDERKRQDAARKLIAEAMQRLSELRRKTDLLEAGVRATWEETNTLAMHLVQVGGPLDLGLLVACAREVLHFTTRRLGGEEMTPQLALYLQSALDTLEMELDRLDRDQELR